MYGMAKVDIPFISTEKKSAVIHFQVGNKNKNIYISLDPHAKHDKTGIKS